jgi:hypothetical protein
MNLAKDARCDVEEEKSGRRLALLIFCLFWRGGSGHDHDKRKARLFKRRQY